MSSSTFALDEVVLGLVKGVKILDVGCGIGKWGNLIKVFDSVGFTLWGHIGDFEAPELVGIDISVEYLKKAKQIYDSVVRCSSTHLPFITNSFDTVLASETIEHIPYSAGFKLILESQRVSRKTVIITTPPPRTVTLCPEHIASWKPTDFKKLGFKVYGVRFYPRFASRNILIQLLIAFLIGPLSYWFPSLSSDIVAVKMLDAKNSPNS